MKYIRKRSNTYYYRRTIPVSLSELTDIKVIYRPLSIDKKLASRIAVHYNDLFTMIDLGLKLGHNVSDFILKLNIKPKREKVTDVYELYLQHQDVSDNRRIKIERLLTTIQHLLPENLDKLSMTQLDE